MYKVYFLISGKRVVYIGMTKNLMLRLKAHQDTKVFNSVRWVECADRQSALSYEARWTRKFMPEYNIMNTKEKTIVMRVPVAMLDEVYKIINS